jgi:hypothetical protein
VKKTAVFCGFFLRGFFAAFFHLNDEKSISKEKKMKIALFTNHHNPMDLIHHFELYYAGQKKRKTFDCVFDPKRDTEFYVFSKNRNGWNYLGTAKSVRNVIPRADNQTPVWELELNYQQSEFSRETSYVDKKTVLELVGLSPKYKSMASGIVPCF